MSPENQMTEKAAGPPRGKGTLIATGVALGLSILCFVVVTLLPQPKGPFFKDPLRGLLTGLCVLGVAFPLCASGFTLKRRYASSPYFEGAFIASFLNLFGFLCLGVGLACISLGLYALALRFLG